jgi:hypothetical protein
MKKKHVAGLFLIVAMLALAALFWPTKVSSFIGLAG